MHRGGKLVPLLTQAQLEVFSYLVGSSDMNNKVYTVFGFILVIDIVDSDLKPK